MLYLDLSGIKCPNLGIKFPIEGLNFKFRDQISNYGVNFPIKGSNFQLRDQIYKKKFFCSKFARWGG